MICAAHFGGRLFLEISMQEDWEICDCPFCEVFRPIRLMKRGTQSGRPKSGKAPWKKRGVDKAFVAKVKKATSSFVEKKSYDASFTVSVTTTGISSGNPVSLFDPAQGIADTERIGDSCKVISVGGRWSIVHGDPTNVIRLVLFQWKDITAPLNFGPGGLFTTGATPLSSFNRDSRGRFNVLYDQLISLDSLAHPQAVGVVSSKPLAWEGKVDFQAGGLTGGGKIYLCAISDSTTVAHPTLIYYSHVRYMDA